APVIYTVEELECKICYNRFDTRARKPKVLSCLHRVCAKCLKKMVELDSSPSIISCPFCRHETHVPDEEIWLLQDDSNILAILTYQDRARKSGTTPSGEVLLTPNSLSGGEQAHSSSDCLVITIMEVPGESHQLGLLALPPPRAEVPGVDVSYGSSLSDGSLPLGIYLLMIQQLTMGVILVSLVPSTLVLCVFYGFCQCLCHEIMEAIAT
ncbi:hypothetical protein M9458_014455, partial [Cirrhinus mrigala]